MKDRNYTTQLTLMCLVVWCGSILFFKSLFLQSIISNVINFSIHWFFLATTFWAGARKINLLWGFEATWFNIFYWNFCWFMNKRLIYCTANPFPVMKTRFSLWTFSHREKPVFITGIPAMRTGLPVMKTVRKSSQGKPCFHYRDGFAVMN